MVMLGGMSAWADELTATLDHTAGAQWGSNTGVSTVDAEKEHYNNDAASSWAACAYAQFSAEIPSGASITEAKLTYYVNQGGKAGRNDIIYYMAAGFTLDYSTFAGQTGTDLRYASNRAGKAVASAPTGGTGERGPLTVDVTDAVKAIMGAGQNYIIFQWTGNAGGADLYGKGSADKAPVLTITTADASTQTTYTVKFLDYEEATLKDDAVYQGTIGDVVAPSADDKADFKTADGSKKYLFDAHSPRTLTLAADAASNVFKLFFVEAEKVSYTLKSNLGTTLASGSDFEGEIVTAYYPRYQLVDGTLYECPKQGSNPWYGVSIDLSETNTATVDYTATEIANVVFAAEGEAIDGATYSNTNYADIRSFGGAVGFAESDLVVTTLAPGKYILKADLFTPTSAMGSTTFRVGEAEYKLTSTSNGYHNELATEEFTVEKATDVVWVAGGAKTNAVDWLYIQKTGDVEVASTWRDFAVQLTNADVFATDVNNFGVKVAEDGTYTATAADDASANFVVSAARFNDAQHGWVNCTFTIPVQGAVKIELGDCQYGGQNGTITDAAGNQTEIKANATKKCWSASAPHENVVVAYYAGTEPTTLTVYYNGYCPFIAVTAIDPAEIPSEAIVTFDAASAGAEGVAPAAQKVEIGATITIPANTTLYAEGKTLTAWTDGATQYKPGQQLTVAADVTLQPVFTANTVTFAQRNAETTLVWQFGEANGAGTLNAQGRSTILVTQATVNGETIDVKMDIDATNGKINNVGRGDKWAQCNDGTVLTIPAAKGTQVSLDSYGNAAGTTIGGVEATDKAATYDGTAATLDIVAKGISYLASVTAIYPAGSSDEPGEETTFQNFAVQLTNADVFDTSVNKFGVKVAKDGTYTATAFDDATANFTVNAVRFNDPQHGWVNCEFTIPVPGAVKIGLGNCQYGSQDGTITDAEGNVTALTVGNGNCWNGNDIAGTTSYTIYKGTKATTLTVKYTGYCPFISVETVDPSELKSDATVTFASGEVENGVVPAAVKMEVGKTITLPQNFTLYVEGKTMTAWTDGTNDYAPGTEYTVPENDVTLTAKFTANEVSLGDRTEPVTLKFNFQRKDGAPTVAWQNQDGLVWVTQATIGGKTIDVPAFVSTNPGKFANGNWNDWAQLNGGTTFTIPSCKGAVVSVEAYNELGTGDQPLTIDGQSDYVSGKTISYTVAGKAETVDVVIGTEGAYYRYIQVVLPVVEQQGGQTFDNEAASVVWALNDAAAVSSYTAQPDGAFSTVAINTGDLEITGAAKRTADNAADGVNFVKFRPSGSTQAVEWVVKPAAGLTFTPTKVSMWIQRFGTDAENGVTVTARVGEGEAVTLGNYTAPRANQDTTKDKYAGNSNYTNQVVIELTAEQQAALASGEGLTLAATVGVGSAKEGGFSDVHIEGVVNGTKADVALYSLTAVAKPEEAGSINIYPVSDEYEEGTEVQLTATKNFGYKFINWTDAEGNVVSEDAKFKYTISSNAELTANFQQVNTYELALTVDGTNDYMVAVTPAPTVVDGKNMYEDGQAVQLVANQYEGLVTFTNWSDGETNSEKLISMTDNVTLTAMYAEADIIAGWDFYNAGSSGRKADFAAQDNDGDALNLVNTETGETSGWLDKSTIGGGGYESFKGAAVNWRTGASNGDVGNWHWQTKVNAEAFTDINVQFQMLYNYNSYQRYDVEYSLDGEAWTKVGSVTMTGAKAEASFKDQLPAAANNQKELYIRMKADKTSNVDGAASANDGNTLAMFFITGTPKLINDGVAPKLTSSVPENGAVGASATGKIVLTFDERVKMAQGAKATLGSLELAPTVSGKTVTFEYKGLEYATEYTFNLPANTVADLTDNFVAQPITLVFTTMTRPEVTKGAYDVVVSNVEELVAAIQKAETRADKNARFRIFVKNGTYAIPLSSTMKTVNGFEVPECITFVNSGNVSFIGESRDGTIITNAIPADATFAGTYGTTSKYDGIGNSDVLQIKGNNYYFQDLTVKSGIGDALGRNLAIQDKGTKTIYKNTCLYGYQDTWTSNNDNGLYYFEGGVVRGRTDYMCGKGDAFFNAVEIRQLKGGYAAVPSKSIKYGYVYKDCTINGDEAGVDGNYTLGRPWGSGTPVALFIDTKMNVVPSAIGWNEMSGGWPKRFAEYNSMTSTGTQIDLSGRKKVFGDGHENNPILTAEEAYEAGNLHNMFGDWDPTLLTEQAPSPTNVMLAGSTLTWDDSKYAYCWAVVKNGSVVDFTTEPTYTVDDASAQWAVRAANEMGGLGEAVAVGSTTAIRSMEQTAVENNAIYNMQGIRVSKAGKGLYIINGKKVVK